MKKIEKYLQLPYKMEIVPDMDEGGYVASYPDLPGCFSIGETMEEAVANVQEAKKIWLEAALNDGVKIAEPNAAEHYSGQFKLRLPKSLHQELAERSRQEGISMNQYCLYLLSSNNALAKKKSCPIIF